MKPSKRLKLEQTFKFTSSSNRSQDHVHQWNQQSLVVQTNTKTCMYHKLEEITLNHAKNYLEMLNQLTAANFYVTSEGDAIFKSHDTISSANLSIDKWFPLLINRASRFFINANIPYVIEHFVNTKVDIICVKNIQEYQQQIEEAYLQPLNWYDENEIKHIMETEIINQTDGGFSSTTCLVSPVFGKEDGKYYELSNSPQYVYDKKRTDPISLYHFARVSYKFSP